MFYFKLTDKYERNQDTARPYPRGAVGANKTAALNSLPARLGLASAMGAVLLGGFLVTANTQMRTDAPDVATAPATSAPKTAELGDANASPAAAIAPAASAASASIAPSPAPAVDGRLAGGPSAAPASNVDMAATGAIPDAPVKKPHAPTHTKPKKAKPAAQ